MSPRKRHAAAALVAAIVAFAGATGCSRPGSPANHAHAAGTGADATRAIWARYVECARTHGYPDWPDPIIDENGRATFPDVAGLNYSTAAAQISTACAAILAQLPPQAQPKEMRPVTPDELAAQRRYAQCMRDHGVPDFPDPNADGSFPLPPRLRQDGVTGSADVACKSLLFATAGSHK